MRKPSARLVVAALAIPVFGGFATYAAAQVSSTPSPQVVIPAVRTSSTKTPSSANTASRVPGHDVNDDKGGLRNDSLRNATGSTPASTPNTVDDHGNDAVTGSSVPTTGGSTPASTPNTVDDHGGRNRGQGGSGHGS